MDIFAFHTFVMKIYKSVYLCAYDRELYKVAKGRTDELDKYAKKSLSNLSWVTNRNSRLQNSSTKGSQSDLLCVQGILAIIPPRSRS